MPSARRLLQLFVGCVVLGVGVAMLLTADLGSDGYSTMVNGIALASGMSFLLANTLVSIAFLALAAARKVFPGIGTVVQVVVVGVTVDVLLGAWHVPEDWPARIALLVLAFPVLAVGIATYLGSHTGAGPAEAAALAYDPPLPFRWSYSAVQGGGALLGWLLGATVGVGTLAVIVALGPCVDLASRVLRLDVHQGRETDLRPMG
ncbi:hypothetical protein ASC64_04640 [Nocardioides sp. Root122]|uniref:hypothetical protein n=1 Tax=Nocardioides TaxID=1839 RepID=UPI000703A503|nr:MULTISPECIES: hypothetical protein [Nocardioides]KQV71333.1 hypothetical protein ASC64_04640 [Nocardioides sp. Root122]MCK9822711.1 hypothetical protein [Nocardioides cavernae]